MVTKCRMSLPQWNHHCYRFFAPPLPLTIAHNLNFTVSCNRRTSHLIPHTSSLTLHSSSLCLSPPSPRYLPSSATRSQASAWRPSTSGARRLFFETGTFSWPPRHGLWRRLLRPTWVPGAFTLP